MESGCRLSVIVPVYKTEEYISKTIESLLAQKCDGLQFIFVDDGSPDRAISIVEKYAKTDERFVILHKENGGLSSARNFGIDNADGEYILFIDSDDYIENETLKRMLEEAETNDLDVYRARLQHVENNRIRQSDIVHKPYVVMTGRERLICGEVSYTICVHMYKRKFLNNNNLRFMEGVYHEDMDFIVRAHVYASKTMDSDIIFYNYVIRNESISNNSTLKRPIDYCKVAQSVSKISEELHDEELYQRFFREYLAFMFSHVINLCVINHLSISDILSEEGRRNDIFNHLKKSRNRKYRFQYFLLKLRLYKLYSMLYKVGRKC